MCHTSLLPSSQNPKRRMNTEQIRKTKSSEEKDQHLCKQALSESRTDLLRSCGCGWDSWEGDCPNTNGLWTREEEGGGWAACSNTEEEGAAERKGPDWMEFSMALNRSPANMETEDGEKLQLMLWFEVFPKGGRDDHSEFNFYQSFSLLPQCHSCAKWEELFWAIRVPGVCKNFFCIDSARRLAVGALQMLGWASQRWAMESETIWSCCMIKLSKRYSNSQETSCMKYYQVISSPQNQKYAKLRTTRAVDCVDWPGHDFCKETLLVSFQMFFFWCFEHQSAI